MLKPIKTKKQYESALERVYNLMQKDLKADSKESDELEVLSILIENYEEKKYPILPPDPVEAIKFRMDQLGMTKNDLAKYLGYNSRVSEILTKKRKLSLAMIKTLKKELNIPYESLIG